MNLRTAIYILGVALLSTFVSCLGDNDNNTEVVYSPDAQITSFSIKGHIVLPGNDTIKKNGLDAIRFSIDQVNGKIFNGDSAMYKLVLPDSVAVTFSTASGSNLLKITNGDTVLLKSGNFIDIRKPVKLLSLAQTGDTKEYTVTFNIHQIDPDSIWWQKVSGDLDIPNQDVLPPASSKYPIMNVFGRLPLKDIVAMAVDSAGIIISAAFDGSNWKYGDKLPDELPTQDFSSLSYTRANAGYLTIAGGTSGTTWGTTDGLYWTKIGNLPANMQGANVFIYDDKFYLLNGMTDTYNKSIYTSKDGGITWQMAPTKTNLPKDYTFRTGASVVVDSENIIYIMGGGNGGKPVTDVWRGRLNRLNQ